MGLRLQSFGGIEALGFKSLGCGAFGPGLFRSQIAGVGWINASISLRILNLASTIFVGGGKERLYIYTYIYIYICMYID